jgi:hypothetical protein
VLCPSPGPSQKAEAMLKQHISLAVWLKEVYRVTKWVFLVPRVWFMGPGPWLVKDLLLHALFVVHFLPASGLNKAFVNP